MSPPTRETGNNGIPMIQALPPSAQGVGTREKSRESREKAGEQRGGCHSAAANFYSLELYLRSRAEVTPMCGLSVGGRAREAADMSRVYWRVWYSVGCHMRSVLGRKAAEQRAK